MFYPTKTIDSLPVIQIDEMDKNIPAIEGKPSEKVIDPSIASLESLNFYIGKDPALSLPSKIYHLDKKLQSIPLKEIQESDEIIHHILKNQDLVEKAMISFSKMQCQEFCNMDNPLHYSYFIDWQMLFSLSTLKLFPLYRFEKLINMTVNFLKCNCVTQPTTTSILLESLLSIYQTNQLEQNHQNPALTVEQIKDVYRFKVKEEMKEDMEIIHKLRLDNSDTNLRYDLLSSLTKEQFQAKLNFINQMEIDNYNEGNSKIQIQSAFSSQIFKIIQDGKNPLYLLKLACSLILAKNRPYPTLDIKTNLSLIMSNLHLFSIFANFHELSTHDPNSYYIDSKNLLIYHHNLVELHKVGALKI